jgi:multiple sugar transport system substrate-binding protein
MKSLRLMALVAAIVALAFAGCGDDDDDGGGGGGGGGGAPEAEAVTQAKAQGDVTWCIGKDTTGAFTTVVDNFNKENPNANAKLLELPTAADEQRRLQVQRLEAESPECDVLGVDTIWTAEYAAQGWVLDVTEALNERKGEFIPSTVETAEFDGKYWAIPFNTNAGFIYWRTDEAGNQPPPTWEDMYQAAQQDNGYIYQGARYEGLTVHFLELLYSAGGDVVNQDGSEATADSQETREVLEFMQNGIDDGAVPKAVTTYMEEESRRAFEAGKSTFMRNWPYAYALGKESDIADDFAVSTFPEYGGNPGAGVLGGYNLAISAYSENPEGSLAFANFATSPDAQVIQASKASLPAVIAEVYEDPQVKKALPFAAELLKAVEQAKPRPVSPVYPQISEAIYNNVFAVLQGDMAPDEAATKMNDEIQQALETF